MDEEKPATKALHDENIVREVSRIVGVIRKEMETILPMVSDPGFRFYQIREAVERVAKLARWRQPEESGKPGYATGAVDRAESLAAFNRYPFVVVQDTAHQRLLVMSKRQYEQDPPFGPNKVIYETK